MIVRTTALEIEVTSAYTLIKAFNLELFIESTATSINNYPKISGLSYVRESASSRYIQVGKTIISINKLKPLTPAIKQLKLE